MFLIKDVPVQPLVELQGVLRPQPHSCARLQRRRRWELKGIRQTLGGSCARAIKQHSKRVEAFKASALVPRCSLTRRLLAAESLRRLLQEHGANARFLEELYGPLAHLLIRYKLRGEGHFVRARILKKLDSRLAHLPVG